MIIKIANLSFGEHFFEFVEKIEDIKLDYPFFGNVSTNVKLLKSTDQIIIDVITSANTQFECDRCTKEFDYNIVSEYQMIYLYGNNIKDNSNINLSYISRETDKIIIDKDVRDFLILSIPMKKLCKPECKGLCIKCGADLNIEECRCREKETNLIWSPLMELKEKINNKNRNR